MMLIACYFIAMSGEPLGVSPPTADCNCKNIGYSVDKNKEMGYFRTMRF